MSSGLSSARCSGDALPCAALRESGSPRKREKRSAERHRLFPRSLQDCKFRASGVHGAARRALLQDGNGSWLNAEGGRRDFAGVEIQRSGRCERARASYPGEVVYLTVGFFAGLPGNQPISHGQFPVVPDVQSPPRGVWDFCDTDRRAAVMHLARNTENRKICRKVWLTLTSLGNYTGKTLYQIETCILQLTQSSYHN